MCVPLFWGQERLLNIFGLELPMFVGCHLNAGNRTWDIKRMASILNYWVTCKDPVCLYCEEISKTQPVQFQYKPFVVVTVPSECLVLCPGHVHQEAEGPGKTDRVLPGSGVFLIKNLMEEPIIVVHSCCLRTFEAEAGESYKCEECVFTHTVCSVVSRQGRDRKIIDRIFANFSLRFSFA